jgi:hypothetical protein
MNAPACSPYRVIVRAWWAAAVALPLPAPAAAAVVEDALVRAVRACAETAGGGGGEEEEEQAWLAVERLLAYAVAVQRVLDEAPGLRGVAMVGTAALEVAAGTLAAAWRRRRCPNGDAAGSDAAAGACAALGIDVLEKAAWLPATAAWVRPGTTAASPWQYGGNGGGGGGDQQRLDVDVHEAVAGVLSLVNWVLALRYGEDGEHDAAVAATEAVVAAAEPVPLRLLDWWRAQVCGGRHDSDGGGTAPCLCRAC